MKRDEKIAEYDRIIRKGQEDRMTKKNKGQGKKW